MERLKGSNRIGEFKGIAERLKSKIVSFKGVTGIVFMGALTREFADKYSDVDIIVLLGKRDRALRRKIAKVGMMEQKVSGVDVDLEVHFFEDFSTWKWDETARWDFSHAEIVFDPEAKVRRLFGEKLKTTESFWLKRIVVNGEHARWYCCPVQTDVGTIVESWVARGDLVSTHYCLDYGVGLVVRIVFALNREFLPPPKWEIFYSYGLKWLPLNYRKLLREALTSGNLSERDLDRRLRAVRELWRGILPKVREETGLTPELISKEYVRHVLGQT